MRPEQREARGVDEARIVPSRGEVAAFAIDRPSLLDMIGRVRAGQIVLMAVFAARGRSGEATDLSPFVTTPTGDGGVRTDQRETSAAMPSDLLPGAPVVLFVAVFACRTQLAAMDIDVAASAAAASEERDRTTIIVATQAARLRMCPLERYTGLLRVIELEVGADRVPIAFDMTEPAVGREAAMRHDGTPVFVPAVTGPAHHAGERQQQGDAQQELAESRGSAPLMDGHGMRSQKRYWT